MKTFFNVLGYIIAIVFTIFGIIITGTIIGAMFDGLSSPLR